jgi:ATP-dependent DNA helicase RecQ
MLLPPLQRRSKPTRSEARPGEALEKETPEERALFDALRAHRLELAREQGVPPYVIAHDRTLRDLARQRPDTPEALLLVDGVGPAKAKRYGEAWLAVIRERG